MTAIPGVNPVAHLPLQRTDTFCRQSSFGATKWAYNTYIFLFLLQYRESYHQSFCCGVCGRLRAFLSCVVKNRRAGIIVFHPAAPGCMACRNVSIAVVVEMSCLFLSFCLLLPYSLLQACLPPAAAERGDLYMDFSRYHVHCGIFTFANDGWRGR